MTNKYTMVVSWSDADACFVARFLDFPGLSGLGETAAEATEQLQTALELAIETYEEENWPLPEYVQLVSPEDEAEQDIAQAINEVRGTA